MGHRASVVLRRATAGDALLLLEWQRHPDTRRFARNRVVPTETEHLAWFARKLSEPNCIFLFAEHDGERVGILRLDRSGAEWEISIIVAPERRGQGMGQAILDALGKLPPPGPLVAEVLPGNEASHALFRNAGYSLGSDGLYHLRPADR